MEYLECWAAATRREVEVNKRGVLYRQEVAFLAAGVLGSLIKLEKIGGLLSYCFMMIPPGIIQVGTRKKNFCWFWNRVENRERGDM